MSNTNTLERTILLTSIVNNFLVNRDPLDYISVIDDMYVNYSTTDEFASLPAEQRIATANSTKELKDFIQQLTRYKNILRTAAMETDDTK